MPKDGDSYEPVLLWIRGGPNNQPRERLSFRAQVIGALGESELWTFGRSPLRLRIGRCTIQCCGYGTSRVARAVFSVRLILRAMSLRWVERRRIVMMTPDPLANGFVGLLIKRLTGAPLVCELNGVFTNSDNFNHVIDGRERQARQRRVLRVARFVLERCDHCRILFRGQLEGLRLTRNPRVSVFHELFEQPSFPPRPPSKKSMLLFVGFPLKLKGVDLLLEAFADLREDFPAWELVCVGHRLEEDADALRLPTQGVRFTGPQTVEEVFQWMTRASALVLPSRAEAMGRVLLEAGSVGRPRVASNVDGIPSYVRHGEDGLLFQAGSVDDLTNSLRTLMMDPDLRERLGVAAARRVAEEYSVQRFLEGYEAIIEGLADGCSESAHRLRP